MKILKKQNALIRTLLPEKKPVSGVNYRPLSYCTECVLDDGVRLVYNGMTGELLQCEGGEDEKDYLIRHRFLVPEPHDDAKLIRELRTLLHIIGNEREKGLNGYTILTTTDCNARCFYCYEKGMKKLTMDEKTAKDVAAYILRSADLRGEEVFRTGGSSEGEPEEQKGSARSVKLAWFGGEPLFNAAAIDTICTELANAGCPYRSSMISNGYLFDEALVKRAKELWKLRNIQITLDGTEDIYNRAKAYVRQESDESPFVRVLRNIELLTKAEISVSIRLNMSRYNFDDLMRLCGLLAERFGGNEYISVYSHLLFQEETNNNEALDRLYEMHRALEKRMRELGLSRTGLWSGTRANACMADGISSVVILPDGKLHSCEHINENAEWGSIYTGETKKTLCHPRAEDSTELTTPLRYWEEEYADLPECKACFRYPQCIRLKHCPDIFEFCPVQKREEELTELKWAMERVYRNKLGKEKE